MKERANVETTSSSSGLKRPLCEVLNLIQKVALRVRDGSYSDVQQSRTRSE
mgnify:CR=1 FL=1|jgi:hypothetical protein